MNIPSSLSDLNKTSNNRTRLDISKENVSRLSRASQSRRRKQKLFGGPQKQIKYPIFKECEKLTEQDFWKNLFSSFALGKFRKRIRFDGKILSINNNGKLEKLTVSLEDPQTAEIQTRKFLQEKACIFSRRDKKNNLEILLPRTLKQRVYETWNSIPNRKQWHFLEKYVNTVSKRYRMDREDKDILYDTLLDGIRRNVISNTDIKMENGKIIKIDGIEIDSITLECRLDPKYERSRKKINSGRGTRKIKDFYLLAWNNIMKTFPKNKRNPYKTYKRKIQREKRKRNRLNKEEYSDYSREITSSMMDLSIDVSEITTAIDEKLPNKGEYTIEDFCESCIDSESNEETF